MPLVENVISYVGENISCPLFTTSGVSPLLTTLAGYLLVAKDPAPGMLLLPPGTVATITRVLSGTTNHYYSATVGAISYRILLNWNRSTNQTGYLIANNTTSPNPSVLGQIAPILRRLRPVRRRTSQVSGRNRVGQQSAPNLSIARTQVVREDGRLVYHTNPASNHTRGYAETNDAARDGDAADPVTLDIRVMSRDISEL